MKLLFILLLDINWWCWALEICGVTVQSFLRNNYLKHLLNAKNDSLWQATSFSHLASHSLSDSDTCLFNKYFYWYMLFFKQIYFIKINLLSFYFHFYLIWGTFYVSYIEVLSEKLNLLEFKTLQILCFKLIKLK